MQNVNTDTLLVIFIAITGAAVLLQALILLALYLTVRKATKTLQEQVGDLREQALPMLTNARELLTRVGPKIESVATNLAEVTQGLRDQSIEVRASTTEILERVQRQTSRLDLMLTGVFDAMDRAAAVATELINIPVRQLSGLAAFARAAFSSFRSGNTGREPQAQPTHSAADKDLFV